MILFDPSESLSAMDLEGLTPLPGLEALTGADFLVTPSQISCHNETTIRLHLSKFRALLVQRKSGLDWTSSVGPRLAMSIDKMKIAPRQTQRLLVVTGLFMPDGDGIAICGWPRMTKAGEVYARGQQQNGTRVHLKSLYTAQLEWQMRGGSFITLSANDDFLPFLRRAEELLREPVARQIYDDRLKYDESDDPLQSIEVIRDNRLTLLSLPHIGPALARACLAEWGNVSNCLMWLSSPRLFEAMPRRYPRGVGKKIVSDIHAWFGNELSIYGDTEEVF